MPFFFHSAKTVSIAINKKAKFDGARCLFSTFFASPRCSPLRMRTKVVSFFLFSKSFQAKKFRLNDKR